MIADSGTGILRRCLRIRRRILPRTRSNQPSLAEQTALGDPPRAGHSLEEECALCTQPPRCVRCLLDAVRRGRQHAAGVVKTGHLDLISRRRDRTVVGIGEATGREVAPRRQ